MEVKSNSVLLLGPANSGKLRIAQHITKDYDTSTVPSHSHSGLIYNCNLDTKYYSSNLNILIEEYPDTRDSDVSLLDSLESFYEEFKSDEYSELRNALDGMILSVNIAAHAEIFPKLLATFEQIIDLFEDHDIFVVVAGVSNTNVSRSVVLSVEDEVIRCGLEFIYFNEEGTNEFKEKIGKDRLVEILESHEWMETQKLVTDIEYETSQKSKMSEMSEALLTEVDDHVQGEKINEKLDFDKLLAKLNSDKAKAATMSEADKKSFVDGLVDEYMKYF